MTALRRTVRRAAMLAAFALASVAGPPLVGGPSAEAADTKTLLTQFLAGVTVRHGVARESLVVLPIVLEGDPPEGDGLLDAGDQVTWRRGEGVISLVDVTVSGVPAARERFVPTGSLLVGGDRERMVDRPVPLVDGEHSLSTTLVCDNRAKPAEERSGEQRLGALAPLEQRRFQMIGNRANLMGILVQIQACLASLPMETETVAAILESPMLRDGVRDRWGELSKLPGAYMGKTVGHVAFFGFRPVEVVFFARPTDYRAVGPVYLRSLAASHVLWAEAAGNGAGKALPDDMRRLAAEATAVLESLPHLKTREVRPQAGERVRWKLVAGTASSAPRANGASETFGCRVAMDGKGRFACLEGIEAGDDTVYWEPYREPGGRRLSEHPDNKGNGAMTPEAMLRIIDRILDRRTKQGASQQGR